MPVGLQVNDYDSEEDVSSTEDDNLNLPVVSKKNKKIKSKKKTDKSSILKESNIILSLGWQGTALKAAFQFNKPIIFYSKKGYPYEENFFSFDRDKNSEINKSCRSLWLDNKNLKDTIVKLTVDKNFFNTIKQKSLRLIDLVGFVEGKLDKYFEKYFY